MRLAATRGIRAAAAAEVKAEQLLARWGQTLPIGETIAPWRRRAAVLREAAAMLTGDSDKGPHMAATGPRIAERSRLPAGKRWRGSLGPSLFMTAVEVGAPSRDARREREAVGREVRRVAAMVAAQRAANDLPPRVGLAEGLADPSEMTRVLLIQAAAELWALGTSAAARRDGSERLVALGALPAVALNPRDPLGRSIAEGVESRPGRAGFAALIQDHGSRLPPDLVSCAKSQPISRAHGFRGLTAAGRRSIRDATALLSDYPGCCGFGTITLPDEEAEAITRDQLARFQSVWMQFARRALIAAGLPPLVVLVAEFHPNRRTISGAPVLHWHYAYLGRTTAEADWCIDTGRWHRLIRWAWSAAFGRPRPHTYGCRVEKVRKDPGRYMSKYLSKARSDCTRFVGTEHERCIPRQWWGWSGELRDLVRAARIRPPSGFLRWCCRWRRELEELGECLAGDIRIGDEGPRVGVWFGWADAGAIDRAVARWLEDEMQRVDVAAARDMWEEEGP